MNHLRLVALIVLLFVSRASANVTGDANWMVIGKVITVVDGGVLVLCLDNGTVGLRKPNSHEVVFVRGGFDKAHAADGMNVNLTCDPTDEVYRYKAVSGAAKTVRVFNWSKPKY